MDTHAINIRSNSNMCLLTWHRTRDQGTTHGECVRDWICTSHLKLGLLAFEWLRDWSQAELACHTNRCWTLESTDCCDFEGTPHKAILMKFLYQMTYRWQSSRRQAVEAHEEQMLLLLTKSDYSIQSLTVGSAIPSPMPFPSTQERSLLWEEKRKNEYLQLQKPGWSLNSKFKESSWEK